MLPHARPRGACGRAAVSEPTDPLPAGELVVRNGKRRGTRLPLRGPATVIGSADGCDVRLSGEGVEPVHCAIVLTTSGPLLRSWAPGETLVNGTPQAECPL